MTDILDQDEYWIMRGGVHIPLEEMDNEHRRNVLDMLIRRAPYTMKLYYLRELQLFSNAPDDVFDEWNAQELNDTPEQWIERRPLIIKLRQLVEHGDAIDAEVVTREILA